MRSETAAAPAATRRAPGVIVALDDPDLDAAEELAARLAGLVGTFKVGLTLFSGHGPEAVRRIGRHGRVFLDAKLHDIPEQVARAAREVAGLGVWMVSVHASGGRRMVRAAVEAVAGADPRPLVAGVTVLTSLTPGELAEVGQGADPAAQALRLALLAVEEGAPALVSSPLEVAALRSAFPEAVLVATAIRPAGAAAADQFRVGTPAAAAAAGADFLVVGRAITEAPDPVAAAVGVLGELEGP